MKHAKVTNPIFLIVGLLILIGSKCSNDQSPQSLYVDQQHERGTWGCGIPCPGVDYPSLDEECVSPNGLCQLAVEFPPITTTPARNQYELTVNNDKSIRFEWDGELRDCKESLEKMLESYDDEIFSKDFEQIRAYINTHFYVPKDIKFSEKDLETINTVSGNSFKRLVVKSGEYEIVTKNARHSFTLKTSYQ